MALYNKVGSIQEGKFSDEIWKSTGRPEGHHLIIVDREQDLMPVKEAGMEAVVFESCDSIVEQVHSWGWDVDGKV